MPAPDAVARAFAGAINSHDIDRITDLMTDHHRFVDSLGAVVVGRGAMRSGWISYFQMVPDYTIQIDESFDRAGVIVMLGTARGTFAPDGQMRTGNEWQTPAAWRALVEGDRVAEWRVYADNEPVRKLMALRQR
jgi:ketosteroid isomerase-like protein